MKHPDGFASNPAFQVDGAPALNTRELYFDGNSQGAIIGGALCAVARDFRRCVLAEAGMNYSTLLEPQRRLRHLQADPRHRLSRSVHPAALAEHRPDAVGPRRDQRLRAAPDPSRAPAHARATPSCCSAPSATTRSASSRSRSRPARSAHTVTSRMSLPDREFGGEHGFGIPPLPTYLVEALGLLPVRHRLAALAAGEHAAARRPRSARRHAEDPGGPGPQGHVLAPPRVRERRLQRSALHRPAVLIQVQSFGSDFRNSARSLTSPAARPRAKVRS